MRLFLLLAFCFVALRSVAATSLVLEMDKDVYRVGELGLITLRIEGATISPVPAEQPGVVSPTEAVLFSSIPADTGFAYRIRWRAPKVGEQTIGPYTLTIDGKQFKSGTKVVRVLSDKIAGIEASFDRIDVTVGSDFHFEIRTKGRKLDGMRLRRSDLVTVGSVGTTTSSTISGGKMSMENTYKIPLKAVKAGVLEIGPDNIEGVEPALKFSPIRIEIKPKKGEPVGTDNDRVAPGRV